MATLAITFAAGTESGAAIRRLGFQLQQIASLLPDRQATGATTVLTFDNAPAGGDVSAQVTAGPITTALFTTKG